MTLKSYRRCFRPPTILLLVALAGILFPSRAAQALGGGEPAVPDFATFTTTVQNREAHVVRGVYVPEVLALPVVQQPAGSPGYVSNRAGETTQFGMAAQFGNVGLLAHNYLSGRLFSQLAAGQEVRLVYGDGRVEYFVVTQILQFQALEPDSVYSSFRDLDTNQVLTAEQLFKRVYAGERHLTLQTCIASAESLSWGRLFVVAVPRSQVENTERLDARVNR